MRVETVASEELPSTQRRILELLRRHGTMTVEELAAAVGVKPSTIRKYALELEKRGLVVRYGKRISPAEEQREAEKTAASPPFFFIDPVRGAVVLRVSSLEQLAAALMYGLVEGEALSYAVASGCLASWLRRLGEEGLAAILDEAGEGNVGEALDRLVDALKARTRL